MSTRARFWTTAVATALAASWGVGGCGSGTIHGGNDNGNGNGLALGEVCEDDSQCLSGECIPFQGGEICSAPCDEGQPCTNGTECEDLGAPGQWCVPGGCVPDCDGRCCGDDGCGGECPDACADGCDTTSCECVSGCTPVGASQPCTAHGACIGSQICLNDNQWSDCASAAWACTTPGTSEACAVGACEGTRECQSDCTFGACEEACPSGTSCCPAGCLDLDADASNCGECGRVCDVGTQVCYEGACPIECARNGSEICDDQAFTVPQPPVTVYLVCDNANGGVAYIASNTGPQMTDGIHRCQGWEEQGLDAWDYLNYIAQMDCTTAGLMLEVDLSAYAGQTVWMGSHDQPTGGGHMTMVCVAVSP